MPAENADAQKQITTKKPSQKVAKTAEGVSQKNVFLSVCIAREGSLGHRASAEPFLSETETDDRKSRDKKGH